MTLFHRTSQAAALAILREGFTDAAHYIGTTDDGERVTMRGVLCFSRPPDCQDGVEGDALVRVTLTCPPDDLADYELVEEEPPGEPPRRAREYYVPAALLNRPGIARVLVKIEPPPLRLPRRQA